MNDPQQDPAEGGAGPDVNFSLGGSASTQPPSAPDDPAATPADDPAAAVPDGPAAAGDPASPAPEESEKFDEDDVPSPVEGQATELAHSIARELAVAGPEGWRRLEAVFAITVAGGVT